MITKTKQEKIKSLTWKYFWKQKFKEIGITLLIIVGFIFIPYYAGYYVGDNLSEICARDMVCTPFQIWLEGASYIFFGGVILIFIISLLCLWIYNNWEKAKQRAKKEKKKEVIEK